MWKERPVPTALTKQNSGAAEKGAHYNHFYIILFNFNYYYIIYRANFVVFLTFLSYDVSFFEQFCPSLFAKKVEKTTFLS